MKKLFFTLAICLSTLLASAQFTMVSTIEKPAEGEDWEMSNFTNNMGIGYQMSDKIMVGVIKNGDDYDLFSRYSMGSFYIAGEMGTDSTSSMSLGLGYSIKVWNDLYIEPNYMMGLNEEDEGEFKIGVAYRF